MKSSRSTWIAAGPLAALLFLTPAPGALAQDDEEEESQEEASVDDGEEEEEDRYFAILDGDVYLGDGGVLRGASILSKNGKIEEIGHDLFLPEGTETLDATGYRVYPGLVAIGATSRISGGLFSADEEPEDDHGHEHDPHMGVDDGPSGWSSMLGHLDGDRADDHADPDGTPFQAEGEQRSGIEDSFDPFSQYLVLALATGITTAEQSNAAIKLKRGEIDGVLLREKNLVPVTWNVSSPSSIRSTREKFAEAAEYLRAYREWDKLSEAQKKEKKAPSKKGVDSGMLRILTGEVLARFNANDREDLLGIARLAQQYHFRPVIFGCQEGWTVADELGRAGAYAVVTPRTRGSKDEKLVRPGGASIENAATLHKSGVQVAIVPGSTSFSLGGMAGRDLLHFPVEAAFGVRGGMSEEAALEAITIIPARILGVDHRVGTLEVGKDMDAIVTDGDLLHYQTFVQWAVVDGKEVYDKEDEIFFAHIRPRPERLDPEADAENGESSEEGPEEDAQEEDAQEDDSGEDEDGR